tara:strand:+ start:7001 stop:7936 length:936 start_codon:yes stop_codon:yes gene_type:complete
MMNGVFHTAKMGDMIYSLPIVYLRGGTKRYIIKREKESQWLKRLFEAQPYIGSVLHAKKADDNCDIDFTSYQALYKMWLRGNLVFMHAICAGTRSHHFPMELSKITLESEHSQTYAHTVFDLETYKDVPQWRSENPWLTNIGGLDLKWEPFDIIVSVSPRYHDYIIHGVSEHDPVRYFDYSCLDGRKYNIGFVGLEEEYEEWTCRYGVLAQYVECEDALEVAQYISESKLFVGNQTSAKAIAEGLKHPRLVETCQEYPDAIPMGHTGHLHISKELVEYYVTSEVKTKKFPEIDPPKNDSGQKEMVTLDDFF